MGDISNGDADDMSSGIVRIAIRLGVHGIVVVFGIDGIDGDERYTAPVFASGRWRALCGFSLPQYRRRKDMRNLMCIDGNEAHGPLALERTKPFHYARARQPICTS